MPAGAFRATADGFEQTLATDFFGPCYLTLLLQVGRQLSWGRARRPVTGLPASLWLEAPANPPAHHAPLSAPPRSPALCLPVLPAARRRHCMQSMMMHAGARRTS